MFKFSIAYFFAAVQSRREENGDKNEKDKHFCPAAGRAAADTAAADSAK